MTNVRCVQQHFKRCDLEQNAKIHLLYAYPSAKTNYVYTCLHL